MAGRRGSDDPNTPNHEGLEALGRRMGDATPAPSERGAAPAPGTSEDRLRDLGQQIRSRPARRHRRSRRRRVVKIALISTCTLVLVAVGAAAAEYWYAYTKYKAAQRPYCGTTHKICDPEVPGKPFNVLVIGSDSRVGLTGKVAKETGAGSVSGQRSDVVRIFHVDVAHDAISVVSIPRDTVVSLLANQSLYGSFNRINVNYSNGPQLLVRTIEANFGIPINHVVQVSFGGLIGAVTAIGGIYMDFPFPALDRYSSLDIHRPGCQLLNGVQALAVARSRHYYYYEGGQWLYDGTSDFGRIDRQDQFMRALIDRVRAQATNLTSVNRFLKSIPEGVHIDDTFGFDELLGLALKFHNFNPNALSAYTLPTYDAVSPALGDVLYVNQPAAQQLLVKVFGQVGTLGGLREPTQPPPNQYGSTPMPPVVSAVTTHVASSSSGHTSRGPATTTTTAPVHTEPWYTFNPVACAPK